MSWSQSRLRKWHRDNPGKSRLQIAVCRAIRRNREQLVANVTANNSLLRRLSGLKT